MHQPYFWKQLPFPVQRLHPGVLLSLALHAVVLTVPLLPDAMPTPLEPEETVSLAAGTRLPPPSPMPSPSVAAVTPQVVQVPASPPRQQPQSPPLQGRSPAMRPAPALNPIAASVAPSTAPTPTFSPEAIPEAIASPTPAPVASPSPVLSPSPALSPSLASPSPAPVVTPSPDANPYADFPHTEGTTSGCGGRDNCWQSTDTQWRAIARTLEQNLQNQGYSVSQLDLETDTGVRVYQVSKAGTSDYYLNMISTFQGTVYLISEQPITVDEIRQEAEKQEEEG